MRSLNVARHCHPRGFSLNSVMIVFDGLTNAIFSDTTSEVMNCHAILVIRVLFRLPKNRSLTWSELLHSVPKYHQHQLGGGFELGFQRLQLFALISVTLQRCTACGPRGARINSIVMKCVRLKPLDLHGISWKSGNFHAMPG